VANPLRTDLRVMTGLGRRVGALAPTRLGTARNWLTTFSVWASDRGWVRLRPWPRLRVAYCGRDVRIAVASRSEVEVVNEMFCEEQYLVDGIGSPELILDLGSNVGASIIFFRARYPKARIIGFEPDPNAYQRLQASVAPLENVEVYPFAIADTTGSSAFHSSPQTWESAIIRDGAHGAGIIQVQTISIPDLMDRFHLSHVDLVKMDIEAGEWLVFDDPAALARCETVIGELHFDHPEHTAERAQESLPDFEVTIASRSGTRANFVARRRAVSGSD